MTRPRWLRGLRWVLSSALLALVAVAAVREAPALSQVFGRLRVGWAAVGLTLFLASHLLRSHRLTLLAPFPLKLWPQAARVAAIHGLLAYLLPAQSGDLALPALLRGVAPVSWRAGAVLLVQARVLDLCAVGVWILIAGVGTGGSLSPRLRVAWVVCGAVLCAAPLLARILPRLTSSLPRRLSGFLGILAGAGHGGGMALAESVAIWGLNGGCLYATARAVSLPLTFPQVWLITTIQLPLQLVPIQGVANAGNHEAGWVAGLALLGVGQTAALSYALATHAVLVAYVLSLAPLALLASLADRATSPVIASRGGLPRE